MKQAELQHYRAMLQAQAAEPPSKRRFFSDASTPAIVHVARELDSDPPRPAPAPRRGSLFGRRRPAQEAEPEPLLLETPLKPSPADLPRLRLHTPVVAGHFAETPFHAEDLADPPASGPTPGVIAGWSAVKPPSAQIRLLRRLCAVVNAEHEGLSARRAAVGVGGA